MSKGGAVHGGNPAGIFVQTNTVAADQEATRETPGTAEKRNTGLFNPEFFIHLYAEYPDSYGVFTCVFALVSYIDGVWGTLQFLLSRTGGKHDDGHSLYRRDPALLGGDVAIRQAL
jgi:hypothetical protein